ncbi:conserved hypothetical protein [Hyella patelloides LEGE 07179]|uniref:Uncharacterized protein n=1 Tax=Hyella patelloides LEGE 07179 TaxID=945734 RepID=A0A563W060_9CYAN|nr:hypothetical protein [Hyella patelloides]VEP17069.1 conserved hypothetical protein [Hyella patelloides LEGE 07179]
MELGEIEQEIFDKYKRALRLIGVRFNEPDLIEAIEYCNYELESKFQAFISWYLFLCSKGDKIHNPDKVLLQAFWQEWKPRYWEDKYLLKVEALSRYGLLQEKLSRIEFVEQVYIEMYDSDYVRCFYQNRMVWQLDIEYGLRLTDEELIARFKEKAL